MNVTERLVCDGCRHEAFIHHADGCPVANGPNHHYVAEVGEALNLGELDELAAPYLSVHDLLMTGATNARLVTKKMDSPVVRTQLVRYALACERVATALTNESGPPHRRDDPQNTGDETSHAST